MQLSYNVGSGDDPQHLRRVALTAEQLGLSGLWVSESYGADPIATLAYLAANTTDTALGSCVLQVTARPPSTTAAAAMTLDHLSDGRFHLGLGASGPQVVEGWHGQPFHQPLKRVREHVEIVRRIIGRDAPVTYDGDHYQLPYDGPGASGLGKPLQTILHPLRQPSILLAGMRPASVRLAGRIADGWIGIFVDPDHLPRFTRPIAEELAGRSDRPAKFAVAVMLFAATGASTEQAAARLRDKFALYIGGMGARGKNFYNELVAAYGYPHEAARIQDLYLAGDKAAAAEAVPTELIERLALVGTPADIAARVADWRAAGVDNLIVSCDLPTLTHIAWISNHAN